MVDDSRYPALIVSPHVDDYQKRPSGGGIPRTFENIEESQEKLLQSCDVIKTNLNTTGGKTIGLARLKLRDDALAKSHRPVETFTTETCPVIGNLDEIGELLVLVSPNSLDRLSKKIRSLGRAGLAHLTSIESFALVEREHRFPLRVRSAIIDRLQHRGQARLKVRIPSFHIFASVFREELYEQKLVLTELGMQERPYLHQGDFEVYAAQVHNIEEATSLASLSFVDRLELMPVYFSTGPLVINTAGLQLKMNWPLHDLPIVGIVDSGIDPRSPLEPLVYAREMCVLPSEYNPSHGTSVAALAAALDGNVGTTLIPRCRLLDITAMPSTGD
jgi:serine protease AprX